MALDSRIIDFWQLSDEEHRFIEITPSGKYFIYDASYSYEIGAEGTRLVIHFPGETAVFTRVGSPAESLIGEWSRMVSKEEREKEEKETWIFMSDGTYIGHWDGIDWFNGFYENTGTEIRTVEFRGSVSTENYVWCHDYDGDTYEYWYDFQDSENTLLLHDIDTDEVVGTYMRFME